MEKAKNKGFPNNPDLKKKLEEGLTKIVEDAKTIAEAPHTKSEKRERILALCDNAEDIVREISIKVSVICFFVLFARTENVRS